VRTVGVILQGGRSRRMGRDKACVVVDGQTMRARVRAALSAVSDAIVQLGGPHDDDDVIDDAGDGPFFAVLALLHSGRGDRYVIAAVDQTQLDAATLRRLLDVDIADDGGVCFDDEPLPCVLAAGARARIAALAAQGERRVRALSTTTIPASPRERAAIVNVNTPEELAALKR
jgi:molybdopterin-guanine dinucleotide biosynthesis protein A